MGKKRNLNGLPNNLVQRYLSDMMYYNKGYMACWIWKRINEIGIAEFEIDILNETTKPSKAKSKAIVAFLFELRDTIKSTLKTNDFDSNFIKEAKLKIYVTKNDWLLNQISCQGILKDIEGSSYIGKVYKERAYPIPDSFFEKIIKKLKTSANKS